MAACLVAVPLILSLLLTLWSASWSGRLTGPISHRLHAALLVAQGAVLLALALALMPGLVFTIIGVLYLAMAGGTAVLKLRLGAVPCGCWGAQQGSLSWELVTLDLLLAGVAFWGAALPRAWSGLESAFIFLVLTLSCTTIALLIPEWRFTRRGMSVRADRYRDWVRGYPELRP
jgi:hypothetical protein